MNSHQEDIQRYEQEIIHRIQTEGPEGLDIQTMLAVLYGKHVTPEITGKLASLNLTDLIDMTVPELRELGIPNASATRLVVAFQLAKKLVEYRWEKSYQIDSIEKAVTYVFNDMKFLKQEHFIVLCLNTNNEVIGKNIVSIGSLDSTSAHPREVFKEAIKKSAKSIICFHNHPDHNPEPSQEDLEVTLRLMRSGDILGIKVLDHVIIAGEHYTSIKMRIDQMPVKGEVIRGYSA